MADKLISQLTGGAANIQDTDLIEGQKNGELITKKFTGLQMRQVEKTERETQDNTIEAGVGLNANGTFTATALTPDTWSLRAADFAAGCTDRGGATGALTESVVNGLRLLDARVYELGNGSVVIAYLGVNSDTTYAGLIPAGYMLEYVVFEEKAAASPILDLGTSAGGNEVFINQALTTSGITTVVLQRVFSLTAGTDLYLNDDDAGSGWDGSTVDIYFVIRPITAGGAIASVSGTLTFGYYEGAYGFSPAPTDAEVTAVLGAANTYTSFTAFIVNDTLGNIYIMGSNGTNWFYLGGWGVSP